MSSYHRQSVEIVIDRSSELYAKLVDHAKRDGTTVEDLVDMLLRLGSYHELDRKLDMIERMEKECKNG